MVKYETIHLKVDGMSCSSCEKAIKKNIKLLNGIAEVKVSINSKMVTVKYDTAKTNVDSIVNAISQAGYVVMEKKDYKFLLVLILLIIGFLYLNNNTNIFQIFPQVDMNMSLGLLFVTGLLTSIHCIAMCGGINISVVVSQKQDKLISGFKYNIGRLISYTILGGIIGGIGSVMSINQDMRNLISIVIGIFMVWLGFKLLGVFSNSRLPDLIPKKIIGFLINIRQKVSSPFIIGLLNGFMPCGPLQAMQIYALGTGSVYLGALSMFVFALGTIPLMLGLSVISGILTAKMSLNIKKISAVVIIMLGLIMFNRGFDLNSLIYNQNNFKEKDVTIATLKGDYQEVRVRFENGRYKSIVVQKDVPVKWIIEIQPGDLNGCNNEIYLAEFNLSEFLGFGDNIIEFTPTKEGTLIYKCWMNMLMGYIYIVEDFESI